MYPEVLTSMDRYGNVSPAPYGRAMRSDRSKSPASPAFSAALGSTVQSLNVRSRSTSPTLNSGSSKHFAVYTFSKSPRFGESRDSSSDPELLESFREAMTRSEESIPFSSKARRGKRSCSVAFNIDV